MPKALVSTASEDQFKNCAAKAISTKLALLFHCRPHTNTLELVTSHNVTDTSGAPIIGPGSPLTRADEAEVIKLLLSRLEEVIEATVFPDYLLYKDPYNLVWWWPSTKRAMLVRDSEGNPKSLNVVWPNLVFKVVDRTLYVASFAGDGATRPTGDTELLQSALPNVYVDGRVCTGDAVLPLGCTLADMDQWESVIFDTAFTHSNNRHALRADKHGMTEDVRDFWASLDCVDQPFPDARPSPLGFCLKDWLVGKPSDQH